MLWRERGGRGQDAYLLLHGLGATGAVWRGVCRELDGRGDAEWLVVDLPGHGRSESLPRYSVGALATAVAATLEPDRSYRLIGHSLGAYVGLALASGWFGVSVASVLGIGYSPDRLGDCQEVPLSPLPLVRTITWHRFGVQSIRSRSLPAKAR